MKVIRRKDFFKLEQRERYGIDLLEVIKDEERDDKTNERQNGSDEQNVANLNNQVNFLFVFLRLEIIQKNVNIFNQ